MIAMPSSVIAHMDYDPARKILKVIFVSGSVYEYKKVPADLFRQMKQSGSKGSFLNTKIKGRYSFQKVK